MMLLIPRLSGAKGMAMGHRRPSSALLTFCRTCLPLGAVLQLGMRHTMHQRAFSKPSPIRYRRQPPQRMPRGSKHRR